MNTPIFVFVIGFLAQVFFSARILLQWIRSERAGQVLSPLFFWVFSIAGSYLLFIYGVCRNDFSIILGQFISYYIYLWNLNQKEVWTRLNKAFRWLLLCTPIAATIWLLQDIPLFINQYFANEHIPLWLVAFGSAGQIIFTLRFVYQWLCSRRKGESVLPAGFWILSLTGSGIIVAYAVFRLDPVLILGQSVGFVAYIRNLFIGKKAKASLCKTIND
ncbi:MAG: lipid-A-disaccharide synthase N-terminal domain-containing protein [Bacteroidaceae bacterium]